MRSSDESRESLADRVDALEESVARLEAKVAEIADAVSADEQRAADAPDARSEIAEKAASDVEEATDGKGSRVQRWVDAIRGIRSEDWLGRVGIGLLLVGLAFLFQYAVDVGWLVPPVRVGFGAVLGGVLLAGGLRSYNTHRRVGQTFLGGSSATFYATVFAAYQLYDLLAYPYAFAAMVAITVFTFALAIQQDDALLGVVGQAGGLATPFLLYSDAGSLPGFVAYVSLVLGGGMAIYLVRGWRSLLWTSVIGGWATLLVAAANLAWVDRSMMDLWSLQGGLTFAWLTLGGLPVVRAVLHQQNPDRWSVPRLQGSAWLERELDKRPPYFLVNASPLLALGGMRMVWGDVGDATWGILGVAGAVLYAGTAIGIRRWNLRRYASAHALAAAVLLAYGLSEGVGGSTLLLALSVEAAALIVIGSRLSDATLRRAGHGLAGLVAVWWAGRIWEPEIGAARLVSGAALSELAVLGLALGVSTQLASSRGRGGYRLAVHAGWLAWWWNELLPLANAQAYISAVWGLTAVALLVGGTWRQTPRVQYLGLATLALFVGKLFLVDLAALPALWRIVLFLASGGFLLLLSYSLPGLIGAEDTDSS